MLRRVKIAASVFFAVLTVALCVFWVRSYSCVTNIQEKLWGSRIIQCTSVAGSLVIAVFPITPGEKYVRAIGIFTQHKREKGFESWVSHLPPRQFEIDRRPYQAQDCVRFPHWFAVLVVAATAFGFALPWPSFRFSLRTMLIATTLVAVVLGLVVWANNG
jgi:membrane protein DedA with SNARE-associated domain